MRVEHIELIHDYFNLDNRINRKKQRLQQLQREFESFNYYSHTVYDVVEGFYVRGFRLESRFCDYIDSLTLYKRHIMKLECKKHHFKTFTHTLDRNTYLSFKRKYKYITGNFEQVSCSKADEKFLNEILEIEQAISFEFNDEFYEADSSEVLMIKLEDTELTNETLEESFDLVAELLGI